MDSFDFVEVIKKEISKVTFYSDTIPALKISYVYVNVLTFTWLSFIVTSDLHFTIVCWFIDI